MDADQGEPAERNGVRDNIIKLRLQHYSGAVCWFSLRHVRTMGPA